MIWTSKDLFEKVLEFNSLSPNSKTWSEKGLLYNIPRLIRFQRINALLSAFGLSPKDAPQRILSFIRGEFIPNRQLSDYNDLIQVMVHNALDQGYNLDKPVELFDLVRLYTHLINYRISVEQVINHNSGVLQASGTGFRAAIQLTESTNNSICKHIQIIDNILVRMIDPDRKEFQEQELIDQYGFPVANLEEIDVANY